MKFENKKSQNKNKEREAWYLRPHHLMRSPSMVQIQYHMVGTPLRGRRMKNSQDYFRATEKKKKKEEKERKGEERRAFPMGAQ